MTENALETTLAVADEVLDALAEHGAQAIIIGALALAIHGYPRATQDVDLAVAIPVSSLQQIATTLEARGYEVQVREPDAQDPRTPTRSRPQAQQGDPVHPRISPPP